MRYVTRAQAGLRARKHKYSKSNGSNGIVMHYIGGGRWRGWGGSPERLWKEIQSWHQDERGWNDVAYSLAAAQDSSGRPVVLEGRSGDTYGWRNRTAATGNANPSTFAVCVLIGRSDGRPTEAELDAAAHAVRLLRQKTNCSHKLTGHRQWMQTECPGPHIQNLLGEIDRRARNAPKPKPKPKPKPIPYLKPGSRYTVKAGDTLGAMAKAWKTTVKAIADRNGIKNPNYVKVGQVIVVPGAAPKPKPKPKPQPRMPRKAPYPWYHVTNRLGWGAVFAHNLAKNRLRSWSGVWNGTTHAGRAARPFIADVQRTMNSRGYGLTVDGRYGPKTEGAVHHFQTKVWGVRHGPFGGNTWSKIHSIPIK